MNVLLSRLGDFCATYKSKTPYGVYSGEWVNYSNKKGTSLYYYITLLLSKVIISCNLVTSYLRFTNEHVCRTLFLLRKQDFYI